MSAQEKKAKKYRKRLCGDCEFQDACSDTGCVSRDLQRRFHPYAISEDTRVCEICLHCNDENECYVCGRIMIGETSTVAGKAVCTRCFDNVLPYIPVHWYEQERLQRMCERASDHEIEFPSKRLQRKRARTEDSDHVLVPERTTEKRAQQWLELGRQLVQTCYEKKQAEMSAAAKEVEKVVPGLSEEEARDIVSECKLSMKRETSADVVRALMECVWDYKDRMRY